MSDGSRNASGRTQLVRQHAEVENAHDMAAMLATLVDEDPVRDEVAGRIYRGVADVAARYAALWRAFPDFTVTPTRITEGDDVAIMEADYTGTHRGEYDGMAPTGRSFKVRLVVVFHFAGGKIASESIYMDRASQLRQIGLTP